MGTVIGPDDYRRAAGSDEYARYLLDARTRFLLGEAETLDDLRATYRRAAAAVRQDVERATLGTLRQRHLIALAGQLDRRARELNAEVLQAIQAGIRLAVAEAVSGPEQLALDLLGGMFQQAEVRALFANVNERAVTALLSRTLRDGLKLSDRVWRAGESWRNAARTVVEDAVARGQSARVTARQLDQYLRPGVFRPLKAETRRRLGVAKDVSMQGMRLAVTEMNNAFQEGMIAAGRASPSYQGIIWRLSAGAHVVEDICDEYARHNGNGFWPKGEEPTRPHPWCFPAGTVVSGPRAQGSTTRWYEGELVEIDTVEERHLAVTPNHPILTPQGWVAAGLLHEGSHVVCGSGRERDGAAGAGVALVSPDDYQIPARIEDVAEAFGSTSGVPAVSVPVAPEDFHGDGLGSEVCVVRSDGLLRDALDSSLLEPDLKLALLGRDTALALLLGECKLDPLLRGLLAAAPGSMGSLRQALALFWASLGHSRLLGRRPSSSVNAGLAQHSGDGCALHAVSQSEAVLGLAGEIAPDQFIGVRRRPGAGLHGEVRRLGPASERDAPRAQEGQHRGACLEAILSGESLRRFAGQVTLDEVVRVRRLPGFAGHVYNLQTATGWYLANGIVAHNCHCVALPSYEDADAFQARLQSWLNDPSSQPDLEAWYQATGRQFLRRPAPTFPSLGSGGAGGAGGSGGGGRTGGGEESQFSQDPTDRLIREIIQSGRQPTAAEMQQVVRRMGAAVLDTGAVRVPAAHRGLTYQGIRLGSRAPACDYHLIKRVLIEGQWAQGTTASQYLADLRQALQAASAQLAFYERWHEHYAAVIASSSEAVPMSRRGDRPEPFLLVVYSADRGTIITGYQVSGLAQVHVPGGVRWYRIAR